MTRFATCVGLVVLGLSGWFLSARTAAAPAPAALEHQAGAEKLRKALDQSLTLEVANQTLAQVIAQLREQTKVPFVLDQVALQQAEFDEDAQVSVNVQNVKLRTGLRTILGPYNLTHVVVGETVVVTSPEMAIYRQLRQPVQLHLDETSLAVALKNLARQTAANLVLDPRLGKEKEAPLTMQLDDVPLETAVRLMAEPADLKVARLGNVLLVTTAVRAEKLRGENELVPLPGGNSLLPGVAPEPKPPAAPVPAAPALRKEAAKAERILAPLPAQALPVERPLPARRAVPAVPATER